MRYVTNKPQLGVKDVRTQFDLNTIDSGSAGGHVKAAFNAPLGDNAAVRVVGYGTRYGGFIDALRATGETDDNVNDGGRFGGRASVLWKPTENVTITPRLVYQNIDMDGFNREEFFNLFANPYTTTRTPCSSASASNSCCWNEAFEDETLLLDNVDQMEPERPLRGDLRGQLYQARPAGQPGLQRAGGQCGGHFQGTKPERPGLFDTRLSIRMKRRSLR